MSTTLPPPSDPDDLGSGSDRDPRPDLAPHSPLRDFPDDTADPDAADAARHGRPYVIRPGYEGPERRRRPRLEDKINAELQALREQTTEVVTSRLSRDEWSRLTRRMVAMIVVGIVVAAYVAINLHQVFINECVRYPYLSATRARVCNDIFYGDSTLVPGPYYDPRTGKLGHEADAPGMIMDPHDH